MSSKLAYGVRDAASQIGVSRATLYRLIKRGELAAIKVRARTLVPHQAMLDYLGKARAVRP